MKKITLLLMLMLLPFVASAQVKFGHLSYDQVFKSMPEYVLAQANLNDLRGKYDAEMKRVEDEFLDGQADFAPTILQKRQSELQELLTKNVAFKAESERLLRQAEADTYAPIREKLQNAIRKVGAEQWYAFILNTDGDACPYIDPEMGEDVTELVIEAMK